MPGHQRASCVRTYIHTYTLGQLKLPKPTGIFFEVGGNQKGIPNLLVSVVLLSAFILNYQSVRILTNNLTATTFNIVALLSQNHHYFSNDLLLFVSLVSVSNCASALPINCSVLIRSCYVTVVNVQ